MLAELARVCAPYRTVAIAGMAKNAGKTTALNHLIAQFALQAETLGISSIGRDGEAIDQLTRQPKPRIHPPVGALVATSFDSVIHSSARLERISTTPFRTALGPVGIYRVKAPGFVEVAGPVKVKECQTLLRLLQDAGAQRIFVDGAADRRAFLSSGVDAFVLSTGLCVDANPEALITQTHQVLDCLQMGAPPTEYLPPDPAQPGAFGASGFVPWLAPSFLGNHDLLHTWLRADMHTLYVPGAVTDMLLDVLLQNARVPDLLMPASTHLLASAPVLARFFARGARGFALRPLKAVALTINPTSPAGDKVDARWFKERFEVQFPDLPVVDVMNVNAG